MLQPETLELITRQFEGRVVQTQGVIEPSMTAIVEALHSGKYVRTRHFSEGYEKDDRPYIPTQWFCMLINEVQYGLTLAQFGWGPEELARYDRQTLNLALKTASAEATDIFARLGGPIVERSCRNGDYIFGCLEAVHPYDPTTTKVFVDEPGAIDVVFPRSLIDTTDGSDSTEIPRGLGCVTQAEEMVFSAISLFPTSTQDIQMIRKD